MRKRNQGKDGGEGGREAEEGVELSIDRIRGVEFKVRIYMSKSPLCLPIKHRGKTRIPNWAGVIAIPRLHQILLCDAEPQRRRHETGPNELADRGD